MKAFSLDRDLLWVRKIGVPRGVKLGLSRCFELFDEYCMIFEIFV
jgi:hypothetical protein